MIGFFKKTYSFQPLVYINEDGSIASGKITSKVRWLKNIHVEARNEKTALKLAFEKAYEQYPEYKEKESIWLY
jgi:hypothetical protein